MQLQLKTCFHLGIIGLLQGIGFYFLNQAHVSPFIYTASFSFILISGLFIQLAWPGFLTARLVVTSIILAGIFAAIFGWRFGVKDDDFYIRYFVPFILLIASVYIVNTFHQVYHHQGRLNFPYPELFTFAWNTFFLIFSALMFTFLCEGLIHLWGYLFDILSIPYFHQLFATKLFIYLSWPFFFGFGIGLVNQYHGIITALRKIVTAIFSVLLPIIAFIGVAFILTYVGKLIYVYITHTPLTLEKSLGELYTNMIALTILFLNAAFQDGKPIINYPRWLKQFISFFILISPIFCGLAFYHIISSMRQEDISLTGFAGFETLLLLSILSLYIVAYALFSLTRSHGWMGYLPTINIFLALCVVFIALFINSPLIDPVKIIQNHQVDQLKKGNFKDTYFMYLAHADLKGLNFAGAKLNNVDFSYADLSDANLNNADLSYARFDHANLTNAKLVNADLKGATFHFTNIINADFHHAKLSYVVMKNIIGLTQAQLDSALCTPKKEQGFEGVPKGLHLKICK